MSNFRQVDRETGYLLPPSVDDWLPASHLARFVVEVIEQLNLSAFVKAYRGSGSAAHHPSVLLGLLIYGYATGVYSSRKLERATYASVAFRFIAANDHRAHDTIAAFRRRFLTEIEQLFVEVLLLARQAGMVKPGTVALDGTKIHADASRRSALSWRRACEIEARLRAEAADAANVPDGMSVTEELARREDRLAAIAEAKAELETRAAERHAREQDEYEEKMRAREEKAARTGRKPGGRPPAPPEAGPRPKDQINLTDPDSAIMPVAGGGFEQCYNAQATVTADSLLVVTADVVQAANDKREIEPALAALARLPEALGTPESLLADSGYFSQANVEACADADIAPLIAQARDQSGIELLRTWLIAAPLLASGAARGGVGCASTSRGRPRHLGAADLRRGAPLRGPPRRHTRRRSCRPFPPRRRWPGGGGRLGDGRPMARRHHLSLPPFEPCALACRPPRAPAHRNRRRWRAEPDRGTGDGGGSRDQRACGHGLGACLVAPDQSQESSDPA